MCSNKGMEHLYNMKCKNKVPLYDLLLEMLDAQRLHPLVKVSRNWPPSARDFSSATTPETAANHHGNSISVSACPEVSRPASVHPDPSLSPWWWHPDLTSHATDTLQTRTHPLRRVCRSRMLLSSCLRQHQAMQYRRTASRGHNCSSPTCFRTKPLRKWFYFLVI